jgi:hypothetical protein
MMGKFNMEADIAIDIDGVECYVSPRAIWHDGDIADYIVVVNGAENVVLAVTYDKGTCGLNDLGSGSTLPPEGQAWRQVAEGTLCWYQETDSLYHSCPACASMRYRLFDTGMRFPRMWAYSASI